MPPAEAFVASVGYGYWGKNLARVFHELGALRTLCDSVPESIKAAKAHYPELQCTQSYRSVLEDTKIRAVALATPAESHETMVRQALLAGKDVFVEKPLALNAAGGIALAKLAQKQKKILMVGHLLWYHPAILKLQELISKGELGRLQYIYSNRLNLGKIRREENILWSFAPHDISVILGLLGEMPSEILTQGGNYLSPNIADVTMTALSFPSGVKAHIFVSWLHPYKEQKLVVVGDRQMAVFDDVQTTGKLKLYAHRIEWKKNVPVPTKADAKIIEIEDAEPLKQECEHFLDCVQYRKKPRTDAWEGVNVLKVLQAGQEILEVKPSKMPSSSKGTDASKIHSSAFIDEGTEIGEGTSIWHVSHVMTGSKIGKNCRIGQNVVIGPRATIGNKVKIQNNVSVYEGVTLEDGVFCGPSMVFTNVLNPRSDIPRMDELKPTRVKRGATLGANCTIVCGTTIGEYSFVGAGAVVTKDIPAYALVVGVPAKIQGWMCHCGNRLTQKRAELSCPACHSKFIKTSKGITPQ